MIGVERNIPAPALLSSTAAKDEAAEAEAYYKNWQPGVRDLQGISPSKVTPFSDGLLRL